MIRFGLVANVTLITIAGKVDSIDSQSGVQLAGLARLIDAIPIVDAIGNIRGLLDLHNLYTLAQGVYSTGRNKEGVTDLHLHAVEHLVEAILIDSGEILLARNGTILETNVQCSSRLAACDVPHLGLAVRVVALHSKLVVGMHLNGEDIVAIEALDQKRERQAVAVVIMLADQIAHIDLDDLLDGVSLQKAIRDFRLLALDSREIPALAIGELGIDLSSRVSLHALQQLLAAPKTLLEARDKFNWV